MSRPPSQPSPVVAAKLRLQRICQLMAGVIDGGRDPNSAEQIEWEQASLEYGRILNALERQAQTTGGTPRVKLTRVR